MPPVVRELICPPRLHAIVKVVVIAPETIVL